MTGPVGSCNVATLGMFLRVDVAFILYLIDVSLHGFLKVYIGRFLCCWGVFLGANTVDAC